MKAEKVANMKREKVANMKREKVAKVKTDKVAKVKAEPAKASSKAAKAEVEVPAPTVSKARGGKRKGVKKEAVGQDAAPAKRTRRAPLQR
jgi:hypothetical protein